MKLPYLDQRQTFAVNFLLSFEEQFISSAQQTLIQTIVLGVRQQHSEMALTLAEVKVIGDIASKGVMGAEEIIRQQGELLKDLEQPDEQLLGLLQQEGPLLDPFKQIVDQQ